MASFKYEPIVNSTVKFMGKVNLKETILCLLLLVFFFFAGQFLNALFGIPDILINILGLVLFVFAIRFLLKASKSPHPSYLQSYIALRFLQARRVVFIKSKFDFNSFKRKNEFLKKIKSE